MTRNKLLGVVALVAALGMPVTAASASTQKNYPLGHAKSCKAHYVKKTDKHKVKGKEVRFVECVYKAPVRSVITTTTTTVPVRSISTTTTTQPARPAQSPTTTTTTIPSPQSIRPSISGVSAFEEDTVCGSAYCYQMSLSIGTLGWPDPKNPPVNLGHVTLSWGSGGTGGSVTIPVVWNGSGINLSATAGIVHGVTEVDISYTGGSYTDTQGGQVTIYSAISSSGL